ncbi:MAG: BON domain-containing protein [Proteobacteria bacterium]|nr:BON domain-containing protein [Pseudomonadota bacterium]
MQRIFIFLFSLFLNSMTIAYAENNLIKIEHQISDSVITTKIKAKYTKDKNLNPLKISVHTQDAVVYLKGNVKNKEAFIKALTLAKETKGVKTVDAEDLIIKEVNTAFTDAYITAKVEAAVLKAKVLDDESIPLVGINASTENGTVTLTGKVKKDKSIVAIIKRVSRIRGVKKVIANLKVNKDV